MTREEWLAKALAQAPALSPERTREVTALVRDARAPRPVRGRSVDPAAADSA